MCFACCRQFLNFFLFVPFLPAVIDCQAAPTPSGANSLCLNGMRYGQTCFFSCDSNSGNGSLTCTSDGWVQSGGCTSTGLCRCSRHSRIFRFLLMLFFSLRRFSLSCITCFSRHSSSYFHFFFVASSTFSPI